MQTKKTRQQIQSDALIALKQNGYNGTIVLSTGSGKSKIAIDAIKNGKFKNILITSPRTNLKENWRKELYKWGFKDYGDYWNFDAYGNCKYNITIENIQTCYKWSLEQIQQFDYIIQDEIHTMVTPEYGRLINLAKAVNISVTGLTATPDAHKEEKRLFYETYCPIIYEYLDSAKDGIVNKRKYIIYEYELTNDYQITAGTKAKPFKKGEKSQYEYLTNQLKRGQIQMSRTGSQDWFRDAANWGWKNQGTPAQKIAAIQYLNAIKYRKEFLWNLDSSADIAVKIKELILETEKLNIAQLKARSSSDRANVLFQSIKWNKVLLFSELTAQAEKLSKYTIHSNNSEEHNKQTLFAFDSGTIRELASCNSLTLGLNIKGANYAIMESYSGSTTGFAQKAGRTDRLAVDDIATVIFIVPKGTQSEQWFNNATKQLDLSEAVYVNSLSQIKKLI